MTWSVPSSHSDVYLSKCDLPPRKTTRLTSLMRHSDCRAGSVVSVRLRVEFLLKTDSGYPKDTGVNKPVLASVLSIYVQI